MIYVINVVVSILQAFVMLVLLCLLWTSRNYIRSIFEDDYEEPEKRRGFEPVAGAPADTILPVRGSNNAAGYDFYAPEDIVIPARGRTENTFLNIKAYMQEDEYLQIKIRSSLAVKHSIMLETSGTIDADYYSNPTTDGNISVVFRNNSYKDFVIKKGERCCQGVFMKYWIADNDESLGMRKGGFGSTGK